MRETITGFYPNIKDIRCPDHPELGWKQWLDIFLLDRLQKKFLIPFGDPTTSYMLVRPVNTDIMCNIIADYWGSIWEFDPRGDTIFVDFSYGKEWFRLQKKLLKSTGRENISWMHKDHLTTIKLEKLHCF